MTSAIIWHISDLRIDEDIYDDLIYAIRELVAEIKKTAAKYKNAPPVYILVITGIFYKRDLFRGGDIDCFFNILRLVVPLVRILIIPSGSDIPGPNLITEAFQGHDSNKHTGGTSNLIVFSEPRMVEYSDLPSVKFYGQISGMDWLLPSDEDTLSFKVAISHLPRPNTAFDLVLDSTGPGPLIQHNWTDAIPRGAYRWIIHSNRRVESSFISLHLRSAHIKLYVNSGVYKFEPDIVQYDRPGRFYLECSGTTSKRVREIIAELKSRYEGVKVILISNTNPPLSFIAARREVVSNSVLSAPRETFQQIQTKVFNEIVGDRKILARLHEEMARNYRDVASKWYPMYLSWSNLFRYGVDNFINFEGMTGVNAIVGRNSIGKSSIIDILLFVLFGKSLRGGVNDIIHNGAKYYTVSCYFIVGDGRYIIHRSKRGGRSENIAELFKINDNALCLISRGADQINRIIQHMIGSYDLTLKINIACQGHELISQKKEFERMKACSEAMSLVNFADILDDIKGRQKELQAKRGGEDEITTPLNDILTQISQVEQKITAVRGEIEQVGRDVERCLKSHYPISREESNLVGKQPPSQDNTGAAAGLNFDEGCPSCKENRALLNAKDVAAKENNIARILSRIARNKVIREKAAQHKSRVADKKIILRNLKTEIRDLRVKEQKAIQTCRSREIAAQLKLLGEYSDLLWGEDNFVQRVTAVLLGQICEGMNSILSTLTDFHIEVKKLSSKSGARHSMVMIDNKSGGTLGVNFASGYQSFIIDLVWRLAAIRFNDALANFLIIDEGFGCLDEVNRANLITHIPFIRGDDKFCRFVIIISHITELRDAMTSKQIVVRDIDNNTSQVQYGARRLEYEKITTYEIEIINADKTYKAPIDLAKIMEG